MDDVNQILSEKISQESEGLVKDKPERILKWSTSQVEGGSSQELEPLEFEVSSLTEGVMINRGHSLSVN